MQLSPSIMLDRVSDDTGSAGTAIDSTAVDMAGYDGVILFCTIATANAGNYLSAQQGAASNGSDAATLLGSKTTVTADGGLAVLDVYKPLERYVRAQVIRAGANTAVGEIFALRYGKDKQPSSFTNVVRLVSPAEGAA